MQNNNQDNYTDTSGSGETKQQHEKKRKNKKDFKGKEIVCECGKIYHSPAALYTHKKTKHQYEEKQFITKGNQNKQKKNQPPPIEQKTPLNLQQIGSLLKSSQKIIKPKNEIDVYLIEFNDIMKEYPRINIKYQVSEFFQSFKINYELYEEYKNWINNKIIQKINFASGYFQTPIDQIFAKFFSKIVNTVDKTIMGEIIVILCTWRDFLNRSKSSLINEENLLKNVQSLSYTATQPAVNIFDDINEFILSYFNQNYQKYMFIIQEPLLLSVKKRDYNLCRFILAFSEWLFKQKYTDCRIKYTFDSE